MVCFASNGRNLISRLTPIIADSRGTVAAYVTVLLLARTITRLGTVTDVTAELVENLYAADFDHLQRLYERINSDGESVGVVSCPECAHRFEVDLSEIEDGRLGE